MPTLPEIIKEVMTDQQTDQVGLSRLAGVTKSAVSQWLSGSTKRLDAEAAFNLQRKTGWSAEYLMLGTGPKKIKASAEGIPKEVAEMVAVMDPAGQYKAKKMIEILNDDPPPGNLLL
jgi:transcriptional regulator with XRE-family HTH domain